MIADKTHTQHEHRMDVLGFQFCYAAYELYFNDTKNFHQIASLLGQTLTDVRDGIDAYAEYLIN